MASKSPESQQQPSRDAAAAQQRQTQFYRSSLMPQEDYLQCMVSDIRSSGARPVQKNSLFPIPSHWKPSLSTISTRSSSLSPDGELCKAKISPKQRAQEILFWIGFLCPLAWIAVVSMYFYGGVPTEANVVSRWGKRFRVMLMYTMFQGMILLVLVLALMGTRSGIRWSEPNNDSMIVGLSS
ncbi:hypothetical protein VTP01DRAFT_4470 [Rhizomucor pusillus]|uniref:uncharacterized protein n=1 Tax=Rhizomucor pusillus TaxID=4840 RepID=UPI003744A992